MFRPWVWLNIEAYPLVLKLRPHIELVENDGEPMSLDLQRDGPLIDLHLEVCCGSREQAQSIGGFWRMWKEVKSEWEALLPWKCPQTNPRCSLESGPECSDGRYRIQWTYSSKLT